MSRDNPYITLPANRFWKHAATDAAARRLDGLWTPKFPITAERKLITVGSCFAQHISRRLAAAGFAWLDSEPAPADLSAEAARAQGYGVFSFRTGNIYTPALLKQWVGLALGQITVPDEAFEGDGRYYDPLRPTIPEAGYANAAGMLAARTRSLAAMRQALLDADIFVFTLGLTEAWRHADGHVYPVCPGTVHGQFDPALHQFHNYSYDEIVRDLGETFDAIRRVNPRIRFLLTVSPVPLTATASDHHVLTATTYSKSVLRAAAGYLADCHDDVDYFPSYEIISSPLFQGAFFEPNMRSVREEGVSCVMAHFMRGIGLAVDEPAAAPAPAAAAQPVASADDPVCEDIILEQWARNTATAGGDAPRLLLVGDSHMGMIGDRLAEQGIAYAGGGVMAGSKWHWLQFIPDATRFFIPTDETARGLWDATVVRGAIGVAGASKPTIITNVGMHSHMFLSSFVPYLNNKYGRIPPNIELGDIRNHLLSERAAHLAIVRRMVEAGYRVIWVSDPPAQVADVAAYTAYDNILCECFAAAGAKAFNARAWINANGGWGEQYRSELIDQGTGKPDAIHGNAHYYRALLAALATTYPDEMGELSRAAGVTAAA